MENSCCSCLNTKATLECGLCKEPVCKKCAQFLEEDCFSFLANVPDELSHKIYCPQCFQSKIAPEFESYNEIMEQAKNVAVFFKEQSKETRLMSRKASPFLVKDCADKDETVMRLAFFAAKENFNGLIDVDISFKKVREGSYQTLKWNGSGIPININNKKSFR